MKRSKRIPTVDIGIPALNEAANIARVLRSVAKQQARGFQIRKIMLLSDGSTDDTVKIAKEMQLPNLQIIENSERQGPAFCWARLCKTARADMLVLLDADIELTHEKVISELLKPMLLEQKVTLTSGRPVKQRTGAFVDKVMDVSMIVQDYIKLHLNKGGSIYGCHGRITAVRRSIFSQLDFPPRHILGNDSYLYLFNKTHGGTFKYVPEATVTFKMPQAFKDFSKQERRFTQTKAQHAELFGDWMYDEYRIPDRLLLGALLASFARKPFYTLCYVAFQLGSKLFGRKNVTAKASWEATTTKSLD